MASAIKDVYSLQFFEGLADKIVEQVPKFDSKLFIDNLLQPSFFQKEYKARMKAVTLELHKQLGDHFPLAANTLCQLANSFRSQAFGTYDIAFMFMPDYVETYGLQYFQESVAAFEIITQFISCEFAVRPFIIRYPAEMMAQMLKWSNHESEAVRRLSTEGCRPRLPWAMAIPALKANPLPIIPILENLKTDPSASVRKSVANNLNDIAKDHPELVLEVAKKWLGNNTATNAIVKHGCRTLLKKGDKEVLSLFNLSGEGFDVSNFIIKNNRVRVGESLVFQFDLKNNSGGNNIVRLEYAVYYRKMNNQYFKKVFKISEKGYLFNQTVTILRKQKFVPITTRRFYAGEHMLSIIVNGVEGSRLSFELLP